VPDGLDDLCAPPGVDTPVKRVDDVVGIVERIFGSRLPLNLRLVHLIVGEGPLVAEVVELRRDRCENAVVTPTQVPRHLNVRIFGLRYAEIVVDTFQEAARQKMARVLRTADRTTKVRRRVGPHEFPCQSLERARVHRVKRARRTAGPFRAAQRGRQQQMLAGTDDSWFELPVAHREPQHQ